MNPLFVLYVLIHASAARPGGLGEPRYSRPGYAELREAVMQNNPERVRALLVDHRVHPAVGDNEAIQIAALNGFTECAKLLLDHRADPATHDNFPIVKAAMHGHPECVRLLLAHGADPVANDSAPLRKAAEYGRARCVELLLEDGRADPAGGNNEAIGMAACNGHEECVKLLLADGRANPNFEGIAMCKAAENGHVGCVQLLLVDGRADPDISFGDPIRFAAQNGHVRCVRLLLADPRVDLLMIEPDDCHINVRGLIERFKEYVDTDLVDFQEMYLPTISDIDLAILILRNRPNPVVEYCLMKAYLERKTNSAFTNALMSAILSI